MSDNFAELCEKLGVAQKFYDAAQNHKEYVVSDDVLLKMIRCLGFAIKSKDDADVLLKKIENKRWQYALEPIYVCCEKQIFDVVVPAYEAENIQLSVQCGGQDVEVEYTQMPLAEKYVGKTLYQQLAIEIQTPLVPQYYQVQIEAGQKMYYTVLARTPEKCYVPDFLQNEKLWGFAIQLYALNSARNWGVGDFTDLSDFAHLCQAHGADVIGVNPLNVLFHDFPENASPYSSISRLFLNPIYIDVEKVTGYQPSMLQGKEKILQEVRQSENIDYTAVYHLKIEVLRQIFAQFKKQRTGAAYRRFESFCAAQGVDLENLAVYQAIYSFYCTKVFGGWRGWPKELQNPNSKAVRDFAAAHADEVLFFKYLQFVAAEQLAAAEAEIKKCGLKIGLYRDLPVGLCKDSVELWAGKDLFIKDCGAGAPPDAFFPKGQKWCLGAFNPYALKAVAYQPFIKILRAAMQGAGALRIDHVMSLMRLYVIPDDAEDGTYIYYNFADMLGLVALESHLNRCMVVGESIGNVPDGFVEKLHARGVYSLSVLWAERWGGNGPFKSPNDYAQKAFCSVGTHDMAPLKMRWFGYDIETMYQLKMIDETERRNMYKDREIERYQLLCALDAAGVWPQDAPRQGDCLFGEGYPNGIMEAVEGFVSGSRCDVFLAQLEDIFGVTKLQNLPGTDRDKHPNWRRKLPVKIEDYETNHDFVRAMQAINR